MADLLPVFQWLETTPISRALNESDYLFPLIEVVHLFGLTLLLAAVLAVNLRLLGLGLRRHDPPKLARSMRPVFAAGLVTLLVTGAPLFAAEATKCLYNPAFSIKMALLLVAVAYHFGLHQRIARAAQPRRAASVATAIISLSLWFGVGIAGRAIGFI